MEIPEMELIANDAVDAHEDDIEEDAHDADVAEFADKDVREDATVP
jgi:hypothetical protein